MSAALVLLAENTETVEMAEDTFEWIVAGSMFGGLFFGLLAGVVIINEFRDRQQSSEIDALKAAHRLHLAAWQTREAIDSEVNEYEDERE